VFLFYFYLSSFFFSVIWENISSLLATTHVPRAQKDIIKTHEEQLISAKNVQWIIMV